MIILWCYSCRFQASTLLRLELRQDTWLFQVLWFSLQKDVSFPLQFPWWTFRACTGQGQVAFLSSNASRAIRCKLVFINVWTSTLIFRAIRPWTCTSLDQEQFCEVFPNLKGSSLVLLSYAWDGSSFETALSLQSAWEDLHIIWGLRTLRFRMFCWMKHSERRLILWVCLQTFYEKKISFINCLKI